MLRRLLLALMLSLATYDAGAAAASVVAITPAKVSVLANATKVFSARFLDASGAPAAGETVVFTNDACGLFAPGGTAASVVTGADGTASISFTAMNIGLTWCYVSASAGGAQVRWDVWVYRASEVYFQLAMPAPLPGRAFTFAATAKIGAYDLYGAAPIAARVIPGTASATITPTTVDNGGSFTVTPDARIGTYDIELSSTDATRRITFSTPVNAWQDLWWSGIAENGWGMSVIQHGDMLFAIIYAYDAAGKPIWYVIPGGKWNDAHTAFTGAAYIPRGSPFASYDVARFSIGAPVGSVTITFTDLRNAALDYSINGVAGRKAIVRNDFGPAQSANVAGAGDLWWGGMAQNGWGITVLQQYNTLFSLWFTYDDAGAATWLAMPGGTWIDASTYQGRIYRSAGSPWLGQPYDASAFRMTDIGLYQLRFSGDSASFNYWLTDGRFGTLPLSRLPF